MATIHYNITSGVGPFTVSISPPEAANQNILVPGDYYFTDLPDGDYIITIVDSLGRIISFNSSILCSTTTTTTCCNLSISVNVAPTTTTTTLPLL